MLVNHHIEQNRWKSTPSPMKIIGFQRDIVEMKLYDRQKRVLWVRVVLECGALVRKRSHVHHMAHRSSLFDIRLYPEKYNLSKKRETFRIYTFKEFP